MTIARLLLIALCLGLGTRTAAADDWTDARNQFRSYLRSERWQYAYRVMFVVPMIVPAMVGLLVWKSFFDPAQGILNRMLFGSGIFNTPEGAAML